METALEMGLERTGDSGNGGPVVRTLCFQCQGFRSVVRELRSHKPCGTHTHTHTHEEQELGWERKKNGTGDNLCVDTDSCKEMQGGLGSKG